MSEERLDRAVQALRDETVSPASVKAAQDRVWSRLGSAHSLACGDFRDDLPGYTAGDLPEGRRLLTEDHLSRCVDCRHALAELKGERKVVAMPATTSPRLPGWMRWAAAAGVVLALAYVGRSGIDSALAPGGPRATVVSVSGSLYHPSGAALAAGDELAEGDVVRTAAGSGAVLRLADGSQVEMNQRSELSIDAARSGDTIRLERGDIMVAAAEQGRGRLRVVTRDSIASVKGTLFAVSSGTAGSLVSVVEGSVEVSQPGFDDLLFAGQQAASSALLSEVGLEQAISWSQGAADYYGLIVGLAEIEEQLALSGPAMRTDPRLVPYLPNNVGAYFAAPNLEGTIEEALDLVDQRASQSAALNEWWASDSGRSMRTALEQLQGVTALLGEELVVVLTGSEEPMPLFLAQVRPGSHEQLRRMIEAAASDAGAGDSLEMLPFQITEDLLLASDSLADLALLSAQLGGGAASPFAVEITDHYRRGVGWLAAVDVTALRAPYAHSELTRVLGLSSMRYLFAEQRSGVAGDESEATLSFQGGREGMASWLAAPGGIGSAEYVSANAIAASAGSTRDPGEAFDQLISLLPTESEVVAEIRELENQTGISVRDDVAAALGTDFVVAVEGVSLGEPAWIAALEVLNPGSLDAAVRRLVDTINAHAGVTESPLSFTEESTGGRTWKVLSGGELAGRALSWTYDRGYLIASTDRATALRAIGVRDSSSSLIRSSRFLQQFPGGGGVHNSGFLWLDLARFGDLLAALGQETPGLGSGTDPLLIVVTGDDNEIRWASRARLTSLLFDLLLV